MQTYKSQLLLPSMHAGISICFSGALLQGTNQGRGLKQLPPLPISIPLPPFLTGNGGGGGLLGGLLGGGLPGPRQPPSLQTQPRANASATGGCTATFAGVLASQPDLFFISSALGMSGFQNSLPSPSLGLTIFAPNNAGFLKLLDELSTRPLPAPFKSVVALFCVKSELIAGKHRDGFTTGG